MVKKTLTIVFLLFSSVLLCFGQTTNVSSIGTVSRDYSTMAAWEAAKDGQDFVTLDIIEKGEMYDDSDFSEQVLIRGATTDATRYWWLTVASGERHVGTENTGTINTYSVGRSFRFDDADIYVDWLEIMNTSGSDILKAVYTGTYRWFIRHLFVWDAASIVFNINTGASGSTFRVENTISFNWTSDNLMANNANTTFTVYHCTFYSVTTGQSVQNSAGTVTVKNTVGMGSSVNDFVGSFTSSDYNCSSDGSAPGGNSLLSKTASTQFISLTGGSEDLHIAASGADIEDAATNLTSSLSDGTDIDDEAWPASGNVNMGADHVEAAAGAPVTRQRFVKIKIPKVLKYVDN